MTPETIGIVGIILLLVLIFLRFPVGLSLFIVGFIGIGLINGWEVSFNQLASTAFSVVNNYGLSVIPLFILMGLYLSYSGFGKDMFNAVDKWLGHFRGGLALACIGAGAIFAAISGSTNASTATLARVAIPEMSRFNYQLSLSTASVAAGGTLGILIPPSVILVLYGAMTNEPIGPLLIAGIIPGLLLTLFFMLTINLWVRRDPTVAPLNPNPVPVWERFLSMKQIWPFLVIFVMSIGGIYFGWFTPTEAGGIGAMAAFLTSVFSRRITWQKLSDSLGEALRITAMIFIILVGASVFGKFLALSRIPMQLSSFVAGLEVSEYVILVLILIMYMILGMFLEGIAILVLTLPIVYPLIIDLGFDGIWFGVIMVMMLNIGLLTPPLGLSVYIISGVVREIPIQAIFRAVLPMLFTMIIFTVILVIFPEIVTFLPELSRQ